MSKVRIRIFVQRIQVNDFVAVVYIQSHLIIKCLSLVTRKSVFEWSIRPASLPKRGSSVGSNVSRTEIELVLPVVNS